MKKLILRSRSELLFRHLINLWLCFGKCHEKTRLLAQNAFIRTEKTVFRWETKPNISPIEQNQHQSRVMQRRALSSARLPRHPIGHRLVAQSAHCSRYLLTIAERSAVLCHSRSSNESYLSLKDNSFAFCCRAMPTLMPTLSAPLSLCLCLFSRTQISPLIVLRATKPPTCGTLLVAIPDICCN